MKYTIIVMLSLLLFTACENGSKKEALADSQNLTEVTLAEIDQNAVDTIATSTQQVKKDQAGPKQVTPGNPDWDKKIIRTASLDLEVKDYHAYYTLLREKVRNVGGYIAQEEQTNSDYKVQNTMTIKVPVDQFESAVFQLTQNIEKLNEKKISSQDVSTEFIDTRSRMESKKQVRQKYLDLLKQAKNMEEILSVQSEINGIQEEIESATGRVEYLSNSSALSTINLNYYQVLNPSAINKENPGFGTKLAQAFKSGGDWIVDLLVGMVSIWPLFLLIFAGVIVYRKTKKSNSKPVVIS